MQQLHADQGELATILDLNRTTINRYQKAGTPYKAGDKGDPNQYDIGVVANWLGGHACSTQNLIALTSLEKVLWGMAWGADDRSVAVWKSRAISEAGRLQASREEVAVAIGFLLVTVASMLVLLSL